MTVIERRWAIRNPPEHRHERATCDVRALPDAIYQGDVEVVPASQLAGAVGALAEILAALRRPDAPSPDVYAAVAHAIQVAEAALPSDAPKET